MSGLRVFLVVIFVSFAANSASALKDTLENRTEQAKRFFDKNLERIIFDAVIAGTNLEEPVFKVKDLVAFTALAVKESSQPRFRKVIYITLTSTFTADEIKAMADSDKKPLEALKDYSVKNPEQKLMSYSKKSFLVLAALFLVTRKQYKEAGLQ